MNKTAAGFEYEWLSDGSLRLRFLGHEGQILGQQVVAEEGLGPLQILVGFAFLARHCSRKSCWKSTSGWDSCSMRSWWRRWWKRYVSERPWHRTAAWIWRRSRERSLERAAGGRGRAASKFVFYTYD